MNLTLLCAFYGGQLVRHPFGVGLLILRCLCDAMEGVASRLLNILGWSSGKKLGLNRRAVEAMAVNEIFQRESRPKRVQTMSLDRCWWG